MITTVEGRATRSVTNDKNIPWRCQERKCHRLISGRHPVPAFHFLTLFYFLVVVHASMKNFVMSKPLKNYMKI